MTTVHIAKGNTTKTATKGNTTAAPAKPAAAPAAAKATPKVQVVNTPPAPAAKREKITRVQWTQLRLERMAKRLPAYVKLLARWDEPHAQDAVAALRTAIDGFNTAVKHAKEIPADFRASTGAGAARVSAADLAGKTVRIRDKNKGLYAEAFATNATLVVRDVRGKLVRVEMDGEPVGFIPRAHVEVVG